MKRYLVTSALPYANGPIHFGHLVGAYIPADVYTRHKKMQGEKAIHISGSDEHGVVSDPDGVRNCFANFGYPIVSTLHR